MTVIRTRATLTTANTSWALALLEAPHEGTKQWGGLYDPHLTDEEIEAQRVLASNHLGTVGPKFRVGTTGVAPGDHET